MMWRYLFEVCLKYLFMLLIWIMLISIINHPWLENTPSSRVNFDPFPLRLRGPALPPHPASVPHLRSALATGPEQSTRWPSPESRGSSFTVTSALLQDLSSSSNPHLHRPSVLVSQAQPAIIINEREKRNKTELLSSRRVRKESWGKGTCHDPKRGPELPHHIRLSSYLWWREGDSING